MCDPPYGDTLSCIGMATHRASTYIIERQAFFAPYLARTLETGGLHVSYLSADIEFDYLGRALPDVVFIDTDFVVDDVPDTIRNIRSRSPESIICIYAAQTSAAWARACHLAGANALFTKFATPEEIVAGLLHVLSVGAHTDSRYLADAASRHASQV